MTVTGYVQARMTVPTGGAAVSATNSGGGPTTVTVPAANYYPSTATTNVTALTTVFAAQLNASRPPSSGSWTVSLSTTTGLVTINCTGTWSLSWTSTALRDVLGFTGNISSVSSAQTGTKHCRGLWIPDCTIWMESDPGQAPKVTDKRETVSPTGNVLSLVGNTMYRHRNVTWSHVPIAKVWESSSTYDCESWEWFFDETQLGQQSTWFTPGSPIIICTHYSVMVGAYANGATGVDGWYAIGVNSIEPRRVHQGSPASWRIELPEIVSPG